MVMHVEYDILNFSLIRQNINTYPREYNHCGDYSSIIHLDDDHLCDTIISGNTDLIGNNIMKIIDLVLSSIHIFRHIYTAKYRIYSSKTENSTNITIDKNKWNDWALMNVCLFYLHPPTLLPLGWPTYYNYSGTYHSVTLDIYRWQIRGKYHPSAASLKFKVGSTLEPNYVICSKFLFL